VAVGANVLVLAWCGDGASDQLRLEQGRRVAGFGGEGRLTGGLRKGMGWLPGGPAAVHLDQVGLG
jgi:hypothetical protein